MKIVVSGTPASGKSTVAKKVAEKLNLTHYSMGDFQREIAKEKGLSINELGELEKKDRSIDRMVDDKQTEIGKNRDDFVIDSRLGCYFIPDAVKVFVDAAPDVRAERRFRQKRWEESFQSAQDAKADMHRREEGNRERFLEFYGFDFLNMKNYDLVVDTTYYNADDAAQQIVDYVNSMANS